MKCYSAVLLFLVLSSSFTFASDKTVFLTFDDGPINATADIIELLDANEVKATFFINSFHLDGEGDENEDQAKANLQRLLDGKHVVANHSQDHMLHNCCEGNQCGAAICNKIEKWNVDSYQHVEKDLAYFAANHSNVLKHIPNAAEYSNYQMLTLARLPYSNIWRDSDEFLVNNPCSTRDSNAWCSAVNPSNSATTSMQIADKLYAEGYQVFGWDYDIWGMAEQNIKKVSKELTRLANKCRPISEQFDCQQHQNKVIVLLHDFHFEDGKRGLGKTQGLPKLDQLIKSLKSEGFSFKTLDQY